MARSKLPAVRRTTQHVWPEEVPGVLPKIKKHVFNKAGRDRTGYMRGMEAKWDAKLERTRMWKIEKGRFPRNNRKDTEEMNLYKWLQRNRPGGECWTEERQEKIENMFGDDWERECFPGPDRDSE